MPKTYKVITGGKKGLYEKLVIVQAVQICFEITKQINANV